MYNIIKRILDFLFSFVIIVLLSPILLIIVTLIKLDSKGPVLFKQKRIGVHKRNFIIFKFRTMKIESPKDMPTHLLSSSEQYITRVGKCLRKTSLDELPQLFNIVKGEMSFVGPRPALWNQFDLVTERDKYGANDIMPGLTGWAQVNGRDELLIPIKAKLDGEYVVKKSFVFDAKCIVKTFTSVIRHEGVLEGGTGVIKNKK